MRFRRSWPPALVLAALFGCGDGTTAPPAPAFLDPFTGDGQTGPAGTMLPQPLMVQVTDEQRRPVPGVPVVWEVTGGGGALSAAATFTSEDGTAGVQWTLGTAAGANAAAASVAGLAAATFTARAVAGPPAAAAAHAGDGQTAVVGTAVAVPPAVRVEDAYGNPADGVPVVCQVTGGGGAVIGGAPLTDAEGVAAVLIWTLGTIAGATNTLRCSAGSLAPVDFTATAAAGPPARIEIAQGDAQTAQVGTEVPVAPAVAVRDAHGNAVAGAGVAFSVTGGGGSVSGAEATTDSAGFAAAGSWTLGTAAGANSLAATVAGLVPVGFTATGVAGPAARAAIHAGDGQSIAAGFAVPLPPAVIVRDAHDNPVPGVAVAFAVTAGGGSVSGGAAVTDSGGVAAVGGWTLGPEPGPNTLAATVDGLAPVTFQATALVYTSFNLYIEAVHLNQANQSRNGSIGGVAGRPGLLRVVVRATEPNTHSPAVRVRLHQGGSVLREEMLPAPRIGVPVDPDLNDLSQTWNLVLHASDLVAGLAVEAMVDPELTILVNNPSDNRFPAVSGVASLDVRALGPLEVVFVPIFATVQSTQGNIHAGNLDQFLEATRQWIPAPDVAAVIRMPLTTDLDLSKGERWSDLLADVQAVRNVEASAGEYYHGIVGDFPGIPYGGLAYVPTHPVSPFRSALSYDRHPFASPTVAHELGHNLGRLHSPCNVSPFDPGYPYPGGVIGMPGYDIHAIALRNASTHFDYMSYCQPRWTSDYTYGKILEWRRADPFAAAAARAVPAQPAPGLLIWGHISSTGVTLNPAFTLTARPSLPGSPGPHVLRGVAEDGTELFRHSFGGVPVSHAPDPGDRHFAFFVPIDPAAADVLDRIEVSGPAGFAAQYARRPGTTGDPEPHVVLEEPAAGRARLRWDAARFPMALVRDPGTGRILAFGRGGDAVILIGDLAAERLEVILSNGVRSEPAAR